MEYVHNAEIRIASSSSMSATVAKMELLKGVMGIVSIVGSQGVSIAPTLTISTPSNV